MLKNLLKIAYRNIWKNKVFSLINIISLSIGLSASFVIGIIVYYDMTFDQFHPDGNRIYRVVSNWTTPEGNSHNRGVAVPVGKELKKGVVGIESTTSFFNTFIQKIENGISGKVFRNTNDIIYTDASYFNMFKYKWLTGEPSEILANPKEVVLTRSRASKYFPDKSPQQIVGNVLVYNDSINVIVTGVVEDFKGRSDFNFKEFLSLKTATYSSMKDMILTDAWNNTNSASQVFVKMEKNGKIPDIEQQLNTLSNENADEQLVSFGIHRTFGLQPISDIHFNADYGIFNNNNNLASKTVLTSLTFVALFLLLLGCINFVNLNTAQAGKRSKEIGIRKTLGSSRMQLVYQFLGETFLLTLAAAVISLFLTSWLLNVFSDFISKGVGLEIFTSPTLIVGFGILLLFVTILSGFYPAIILSHFKPISILKNEGLKGQNKSSLRKYFTVFQFVIAQVFIIATLLVSKQIYFLMSADMGIKINSNVYIRAWHDSDLNKRMVLMDRLKGIPQISQLSIGGNPPISNNTNSSIATYLRDGNEIHTNLELLFGDKNYRKLYDIDLVAGRERLNDTIQEYVINETYAQIMGFTNPEDAVGQTIKLNKESFPVVGVMEDFHQHSLHTGIKPMALVGDSEQGRFSQYNTIHFSLDGQVPERWPDALIQVEELWKSIYPEGDFEMTFMDDTVKQFYEQERKTSILLSWATGLTILISCLGLLGLVIYTTEQRTKEIGIRKVLGATLAQLNLLLGKEFLILVGIAFAIAVPIAWYGLKNWLQGFAYKTDLSWWVFVLSGIAMLLFALVIISIRTIAAANQNPVKSLRTE